jgi:hypothetical protein
MDAQPTMQKNQTKEAHLDVEHKAGRFRTIPQGSLQTWISLQLVESGQILPLTDLTEFTLGRSTHGQTIIPDIDLTAFNAYAYGVSRLHAAVKLVNNRIVVVDLGSSNGTYLNGTRLYPYMETQATHGDLVSLGKLEIQILVE